MYRAGKRERVGGREGASGRREGGREREEKDGLKKLHSPSHHASNDYADWE